jgi:hypothetical protein
LESGADMKTVRPDTEVLYTWGDDHKCMITCYPQSRWNVIGTSKNKVVLNNRNTTIEIKKDDFVRNWVEA